MSVRSLDRLRQLANRPTPGPAAERILDVGGGGGGGGGGLLLKAFVVKTVGNESLTCREWNLATSTEGATDVYVLKVHPLRLSTWNGKTIGGVAYSGTAASRTATLGAVTETQVVTPDYITTSPNGWNLGAGIWALQLLTPITADSHSCTYQEIDSGRAWAWNGL